MLLCAWFLVGFNFDSASFIDTGEEKYKTTIMRDHRQDKKRNEKNKTRPVGL
jgi:hypothetical protein